MNVRRKDREVTQIDEMLGIIQECKVIRVATVDEEGIYIIPLNYGYRYAEGSLVFYIHSAKEGRKVEAFKKDNRVGFELDCAHRLVEGEIACKYGYAYKSIIGSGIISLLDDMLEKKVALSILMKQQTGQEFVFEDKMLAAVNVYKIEVTNFAGKQRL